MARTAVPRRLGWQLTTVVAKLVETPRVMTVRLASDAWPGHLPGQHIDVRLTADDGYQAQRSYSIASAPTAGQLDLTVEEIADGEVSPYLSEELRPGDRLELRGPIGGYLPWTEANGGAPLLVAGGSGIAPLMSMLRYRKAIASDIPVTLLYSSRSWEEIIYREELDRLSANPASRLIHTLTRSHPDGWDGYTRRIDAAMLENVANELVTLGFPTDRVKTERFGPTGAGG